MHVSTHPAGNLVRTAQARSVVVFVGHGAACVRYQCMLLRTVYCVHASTDQKLRVGCRKRASQNNTCCMPLFPLPCCRSASAPPDPKAFILKGEGEKIRTAKLASASAARSGSPAACTSPTAAAAASSKRIDSEHLPSPPKAGATQPRSNPPNTTFRKFYERGDLPISVDHKSFKNTIKWKVRRGSSVVCTPLAHRPGLSW